MFSVYLQKAYFKTFHNFQFILLTFPLLVPNLLNTLWTGDADLRLYITTVQDG